jgi:hypothetical protein
MRGQNSGGGWYTSNSVSSDIKREDGMRRHAEKWTLVPATISFGLIRINMGLIIDLITITVHDELAKYALFYANTPIVI